METVFWGLVYLEGQLPDKNKMENALKEAGFDLAHNSLSQASYAWSDHQ